MTKVYIGIGSNVEREKHIQQALVQLKTLDDGVKLSKVYESDAVGFKSEAFYNLVAELKTALNLKEFSLALRKIEFHCGRDSQAKKFEPRTIDLDILLFGDVVSDSQPELPRSDIYRYPFVIQPLYELCPELILPKDGRTVRQVWLQAKDLHFLKEVKPWFDF